MKLAKCNAIFYYPKWKTGFIPLQLDITIQLRPSLITRTYKLSRPCFGICMSKTKLNKTNKILLREWQLEIQITNITQYIRNSYQYHNRKHILYLLPGYPTGVIQQTKFLFFVFFPFGIWFIGYIHRIWWSSWVCYVKNNFFKSSWWFHGRSFLF